MPIFVNPDKEIPSRVQQAGIEATLIEDKNRYLEKISLKINEIKHTRWVLEINGRYFDYIIFYYETIPRSTPVVFLNYIVAGTPVTGKNPYEEVDRTHAEEESLYTSNKGLFGKIFDRKWWAFKLAEPTFSAYVCGRKERGKVIDIYWEGYDKNFCSRLGADSVLKQKIIERSHTDKKVLKTSIFGLTSPTHYYGKIETQIIYPTAEDFEMMNIIARHIKEVWFG